MCSLNKKGERMIKNKKQFLNESNKVNCHPGGFTDGRRVNGSEPSPGSEQIEHTKTECLYAKLCEREGNPRQLVSGSYQPGDSTPDLSDSEHTRLVNNSPVGRFRMTKKVIPRVNEETTCQKKRI